MLKRMRTYLGVIFAIFARDVKRVLRNPVALVIALGMIVMPSAYAWYVVAANWDPYSNTADVLVAVANEDAGADSPETGHLDVGAQVVAQLHDNHEMGWEFTDAEAAINGVYEGRYWAALVIPKDFSEDFASVFTGDFTQPTIDYYVNEKPSSIAPKVTDAAANAVEAAVNENFVKTVSEKVVETTQKVGCLLYTSGSARSSLKCIQKRQRPSKSPALQCCLSTAPPPHCGGPADRTAPPPRRRNPVDRTAPLPHCDDPADLPHPKRSAPPPAAPMPWG